MSDVNPPAPDDRPPPAESPGPPPPYPGQFPGSMPPPSGGYGPPGGPGGYGPPPYGQQPYGYVSGPVDCLNRPLAEWWQRAVAIIIDTVMLSIVFSILNAIFGGGGATVVNSNGTTTVHAGHLVVAEIIEIVLTLAYFGLTDGSVRGQTLGKLAMGIATRDLNTGGPIGTWRAVLRRFIYVILWIAFFIPGLLNALSPLWDKRRQAWHDKAASSDVIKVR